METGDQWFSCLFNILHVHWDSPHEYLDMDDGIDLVPHHNRATFRDPRWRYLFQFRTGAFLRIVSVSYVELTWVTRRSE